MNKEKIKKYKIFSIALTFILGTFLHFTYRWSGENPLVGIVSSINESTWEHLKLLYFPMLFTTLLGYFSIGKNLSNFICAKTVGILISITFTIVFFYTYTGILGYNIAIIDISSFFVSAILGEFTAYLLIVNNFKCNNIIAIIVLTIVFLLFAIFTFCPLKIGLFKSPI